MPYPVFFYKRLNVVLLLIGLFVFQPNSATSQILPASTNTYQSKTSVTPVSVPQSLKLDRPMIPYRDYPFPEVPFGQLWQPDALPQVQTYSAVPRAHYRDLSKAGDAVRVRVNALKKDGKGAEAYKLLDESRNIITDAYSLTTMASIVYGGQGGYPADKAAGFKMYERAAEYNPSLFLWLGHNTQAGEQAKLYYWSRGLSRGCTQCLSPLIKATTETTVGSGRKKETVSVPSINLDLALRYAVFAVDIGDIDAPNRLLALMVEIDASPESVTSQTRTMVRELRNDARKVAGRRLVYGLPHAVQQQTRSGLIPQSIVTIARYIDEDDTQAAVSVAVLGTENSRFFPELINTLMRNDPNPDINGAAKVSLIFKSVEAGDPTHATAAALSEKLRLPRFIRNGNGWRQIQKGGSGQNFIDFGQHNQTIPPASALYLAKPRPKGTSIELFNKASKCVNMAIRNNQGRGGFVEASAILRCRGAIRDAWERNPEIAELGLLTEARVRSLVSATIAARQDMQRKVAAEQAQIRQNRIRQMGKDMIQAERDSHRRLGLPMPTYDNNFEIMDKANRIYEVAKARVEFDMATNQPRAISTEPGEIADLLDELVARKAAVKAGTASSYAGPKESETICSIWSFAMLAVCD